MVYLFLADGFEDIEATVPFDFLQRAGIPVRTVGVGHKTVRSAHGLTVTADMDESEWKPDAMEAVIFPGGMPGAANLKKSAVVSDAIQFAVREKKVLAAICAAPGVVLSKTGVLEGKKYTCFPGFEVREGIYTAKRTEKDGLLITANGPGAAMEFAYAIIETLRGKDRASDLQKQMKQ